MGATYGWTRGRHAVAVAAVLFYAFLASWAPVGFSALASDPQQQTYVLGQLDDSDEDILAGGLDLAPAAGVRAPDINAADIVLASCAAAPDGVAPRIARARDPPSLKI